MKVQYLIRLDDAGPTMNRRLWSRMEVLLDKYGVKPMVGVIPHNEDSQQKIDTPDEMFWAKVKAWRGTGITRRSTLSPNCTAWATTSAPMEA